MGLSETFFEIFNFLLRFWQSLPQEKKEEIYSAAADSFGDLFKDFYRNSKS